MAKTNFFEAAKGLQTDINALLERMAVSQNAIGELLTGAKNA